MVAALGDDKEAHWLEPAHGTGTFLKALAAAGVDRQRIAAVDLDRAASDADTLAVTQRGIDFLRWARSTKRKFDRIIGNPPYVAIRQLPQTLQVAAAAVRGPDRNPIGLGANTWYAFVLASIELLNHGGSLAFILPSAAEYADYAAAIRPAIGHQFEKLELYRCERPLFAGVQEGTIVAIARGYGMKNCRVRRRQFPTSQELITSLLTSGKSTGRPCPTRGNSCNESLTRLGSIAEIHLGGVTGDAKYFLLSEERRRLLKLPIKSVVPVVSRARHLRKAFIDPAEWNVLLKSRERVWLFKPPQSLVRETAVLAYLRLERRAGGCERGAYKVRNRDPWYDTPLPHSPHAFLSGMDESGPWMCINEMPTLNATNTLYVVRFREEIKENARYAWALALISSAVQRQCRRIRRRYADGLTKYEPGGISNLRLPRMRPGLKYKELYIRAIGHLVNDERAAAQTIADQALV